MSLLFAPEPSPLYRIPSTSVWCLKKQQSASQDMRNSHRLRCLVRTGRLGRTPAPERTRLATLFEQANFRLEYIWPSWDVLEAVSSALEQSPPQT